MEIQEGNNGQIALIAYDEKGNKFTNCSSLQHYIDYEQKQDAFIDGQSDVWESIGKFVKENLEIIKLSFLFDENIGVHFKKDLSKKSPFDEKYQLHNNFGICSLNKVVTSIEGLSHIRTTIRI